MPQNFVNYNDAETLFGKVGQVIDNIEDEINGLSIIALKETSPATAAHAVGSFLTYNNDIYEVTKAIAVGDTLVSIAGDTQNIKTAVIPEGTTVYWEDGSEPVGQVQSDWNESDTDDPAYIKNKPVRQYMNPQSGVHAFKIGNVVTLSLVLPAKTLTGGWEVLQTLPEAYRPSVAIPFLALDNSANTWAENIPLPMQITTYGEVKILGYADHLNVQPFGTVTYIV